MKRLKLFFAGLFIFGGFVFAGSQAHAADLFKNVCDGGAANGSAACRDSKAVQSAAEDNPIYGPNGILTRIINLMSVVIAIVAVISIMYAGLKYITSGSNPQEANSARERIIYACIALLVVSITQVIVKFVIGKV